MDFTRRRLVATGGAGAAALLLGTGPFAGARPRARVAFSADPFTLGVASGDPGPGGVVLWTRLAPEPFAADGLGGVPQVPVAVRYEVAHDEAFRRVVRRGTEEAAPELGHAVHAEVGGLEPDREYFYRFTVGDAASPVGRTRTALAPRTASGALKLAFASCQNWPAGFFTALGHLAQEELHVVFHLGDYIYEGEIREGGPRAAPPAHVRPEPTTLAGYRLRYALYKQDPDLQAAHHAFPFVVTTDDHEVENNYADELAQDPEVSPEAFLVRRAAAYQAFYEHMPLRRRSRPSGPDMQIFRRLRYGDLAEFNVLDFRQYSDDQPCGDGDEAPCAEVYDPDRTVLGARQERWLHRGFARSRARWNVLAQQTIMAKLDQQEGPGEVLRLDKWHAFPHARDRLFGQMLARGLSNPVVITGDVHENYVADLKLGFDDPDGPLVATEFVGTSVTSQGDGADVDEGGRVFLAENPWVKFYNAQRGYVRCEVTPERWGTDFRVVPYVTRPGAPVSTRSSWEVRDGVPGAQRTA